jgi:DNA replication protein DnaC
VSTVGGVSLVAAFDKGEYIARAEPIIFIGDSWTGKTHLLTGCW